MVDAAASHPRGGLQEDHKRALFDASFVFAYFFIGVLVLKALEGWRPDNIVYFLAMTASTVGYGDFAPTTFGGRWFVAIYAPLGVAVVFGTIARQVMVLQRRMRGITEFVVLKNDQYVFDLPIASYSPEEVAKRISFWRRYVTDLSPVLAFTLVNTAASYGILGLSWSNSFYLSVVTCTTIGYGDVGSMDELSPPSKYIYSLYQLCYVAIFTASIHECFVIRHQQRLVSGREAIPLPDQLERMLLTKFAKMKQHEIDGGVEPQITEADYVIQTLLNGNFVEPQLLMTIRRMFHWTALNGDSEATGISVDDLHASHRKEAVKDLELTDGLLGELVSRASFGQSMRDVKAYAETHAQETATWRRQYWDVKVEEIRRDYHGTAPSPPRDVGPTSPGKVAPIE